MKLNKIHHDLKELYKDIQDTGDFIAFGFKEENEINRTMTIFKKGYWSVMPFAFGPYASYGVKLHPKNSIENSSIVRLNNSDGVTIAANLQSFLPLLNLTYADEKEVFESHYILEKDKIKEMSLPFREYVNAEDSLDYFYNYLESLYKAENLAKHQGNFSQVYLDFWNHYNDTPEQKKYSVLIKNLVANEEFYPEYKNEDFGLWNSRMYHVLAQRAYVNLNADFHLREKHMWRSLINPHGFDAVGIDFGIIVNPSSNSAMSILKLISGFNPELSRTFSKEVLEHPLYDAIQELRVRGRGYMGERHIEAAAILDTEYNDPYGAWDALVTASYWAGQAGSKAIEPMWEAAIYLSEKHNWKEIHEVLVQQYEYYNFYKDKV